MNLSTQNKLIEFAIADAPNIEHNFKHFTFILERNKILSVGKNNPEKTHPLALKFGHRFNCIHSELAAIVNFPRPNIYLRACTLVNVRVGVNGDIRISKPCHVCQYMLAAFNITDIYYTNRNGNFERMG